MAMNLNAGANDPFGHCKLRINLFSIALQS
jgi:hypothetical protein